MNQVFVVCISLLPPLVGGCAHFETEVSKPRTLFDGSVVQGAYTERINLTGMNALAIQQFRERPGETIMEPEAAPVSFDRGIIANAVPGGEIAIGEVAASALLRPTTIHERTNVAQQGAAPSTINNNSAGGSATGGSSSSQGGNAAGGNGGNSQAGSASVSGAASGSTSNSAARSNSDSDSAALSGSRSNSTSGVHGDGN